MSTFAFLFDSLEWDPGVIGVLAVAISVLVLCGSVWLLLATNSGSRLGFLLAFTGFFGWMFLMGLIWWIYAIGLIGSAPAWEEEQILIGDQVVVADEELVRDLPFEPGSFTAPEDWDVLAEGDSARAEAQATADEAILADPALQATYGITGTGDYLPLRAFETGGDRSPAPFGYDGAPFGWFGSPHYLVIQVQPALPAAELDLNAAPEPRVVDPDAPLVSVVMVRNQGDVRFPPAMVTIASGLALALGCWLLHRRDQAIWAREDAAAAA